MRGTIKIVKEDVNNYKEEANMKFKLWNNGKKVELEILEKVSEYKLLVNVSVNGEELIDNTVASICRINNKPECLYLSFNSNGENNFLCICNKKQSIDKRNIADWIWENFHNNDTNSSVYGFTTHHWQNWEQQ